MNMFRAQPERFEIRLKSVLFCKSWSHYCILPAGWTLSTFLSLALRLVVRRLWILQPKWDLLHRGPQHPEAERHQVAPLQRSQLLSALHFHDGTTLRLLTTPPKDSWELPLSVRTPQWTLSVFVKSSLWRSAPTLKPSLPRIQNRGLRFAGSFLHLKGFVVMTCPSSSSEHFQGVLSSELQDKPVQHYTPV